MRFRSAMRDVAVRTRLLDYRPLGWTPEFWEHKYANRDTDGYAELQEAARYGILGAYLGWLGESRSRSILDVGCGTGVLRRRLHLGAEQHYVGIDPTLAAIEQANEDGLARTEFVHGDPVTADLGTFDVVVCSEVLYFAPDPFALISRLHSFLAPQGHLLVSIWRHPGDVRLWQELDRQFILRDRVTVRAEQNPLAPRGWMLACYANPRPAATAGEVESRS